MYIVSYKIRYDEDYDTYICDVIAGSIEGTTKKEIGEKIHNDVDAYHLNGREKDIIKQKKIKTNSEFYLSNKLKKKNIKELEQELNKILKEYKKILLEFLKYKEKRKREEREGYITL